MATIGLFDPDLSIGSWFDDGQQIKGWFDNSLIADSSVPTPQLSASNAAITSAIAALVTSIRLTAAGAASPGSSATIAIGGSVGSSTGNNANFLSASVTATTVLTVAGWCYVEDISSGTFPSLMAFYDGTNYYWLGLNGGALEAWHTSSGFSTSVGSPTVGQWVYAGLILNGTTLTAYASINNAASAIASVTVTGSSVNAIRLLKDWTAADHMGGHWDYVRVWNAALSQAELDIERLTRRAVRSANLLSDSQLPSIQTLGAWTSNGTLTNGPDSPYVTSVVSAALQAGNSAVTDKAAALTSKIALVASNSAVTNSAADIASTPAAQLAAANSAVTDKTAAMTTRVAITATVQATTAYSAVLQTTLPLSSSAQAVTSQSAALQSAIRPAGTSSAITSAQAALNTAITLAAAGSAVPASLANLTVRAGLASASVAVTNQSAALSTAIRLVASNSASTSGTASLGGGPAALAAAGSATPGGSATLTTVNRMSASNASVTAQAAALLTAVRLSSSVAATTDKNVQLGTAIPLTAAQIARTLSAANLSTAIIMQASAASAPASSATLQTLIALYAYNQALTDGFAEFFSSLVTNPKYIVYASAKDLNVKLNESDNTVYTNPGSTTVSSSPPINMVSGTSKKWIVSG